VRSEVAPWWPFADGPLPAEHRGGTGDAAREAPEDPAAVLARLEPLAVDVRTTPVTDVLRAAYEALAAGSELIEFGPSTSPRLGARRRLAGEGG
jgi:hypothetical protein